MDNFTGPVISTHQNCRAITPGERQIPDELLRQIIDRGAVIGHSMDTWMLYRKGVDWANIPPRRDVFPESAVTLEDYCDHIDHVCQMAGNSLHSAIGGDTDGQGGADGAPYEVDTVADYQKVAEILDGRGYKQDDIENIMFRNWQRFFEKWLPA
jgi:membrane dipeptidase